MSSWAGDGGIFDRGFSPLRFCLPLCLWSVYVQWFNSRRQWDVHETAPTTLPELVVFSLFAGNADQEQGFLCRRIERGNGMACMAPKSLTADGICNEVVLLFSFAVRSKMERGKVSWWQRRRTVRFVAPSRVFSNMEKEQLGICWRTVPRGCSGLLLFCYLPFFDFISGNQWNKGKLREFRKNRWNGWYCPICIMNVSLGKGAWDDRWSLMKKDIDCDESRIAVLLCRKVEPCREVKTQTFMPRSVQDQSCVSGSSVCVHTTLDYWMEWIAKRKEKRKTKKSLLRDLFPRRQRVKVQATVEQEARSKSSDYKNIHSR